MSKKKAKKAPAKKAAPKKAKASKPVAKAVAKTTKAKGPRSQILPGMEQVRNHKLDAICEDIAEGRAEINRLSQEDDQNLSDAMGVMQHANVPSYRHAGVELTLAVGTTKIRCKLLKDKSESGGPAKPAPVANEPSALDEMGVEDEAEPEGDEA